MGGEANVWEWTVQGNEDDWGLEWKDWGLEIKWKGRTGDWMEGEVKE